MSRELGGWRAKLPVELLDKSIELSFRDTHDKWWGVRQFYPSHSDRALDSASAPDRIIGQAHDGLGLVAEAAAATRGREPTQRAGGSARALRVRFNNYARPQAGHRDPAYYHWRVFVEEPSQVLRNIRQVSYLLHPTFPNPFRTRRDPRTRFALDASGWGEFDIEITVAYNNGDVDRGKYHLRLSAGPAPPSDVVDSTWERIGANATDYRWPEGDHATCPAGGASRASNFDAQTNLFKNRTDTPESYYDVTWSALRDLPVPRNTTTNRANFSLGDLALAAQYEGLPVAVVGFLSGARAEGAETTNCGATSQARVDWQLSVTGSPRASRSASVVAEITPRVRPHHPGWKLAQLQRVSAAGDSVRVSGWLMFDPAHYNQMWQYKSRADTSRSKTRVTLWEIHPVTKVEVRRNGAWVDLDLLR